MHIYKVLLAFFLLSSCGGGSSSSDNQINPPTIQPPSLTNETCLNTQVTDLKRCNLVHDSIERFYYIFRIRFLSTSWRRNWSDKTYSSDVGWRNW